MKFFSSNLDFEIFIAIMIMVENRFWINRTLIEKTVHSNLRIHFRLFAMRPTKPEMVLIFRIVPPLSERGHLSFEQPMPSG
jgi:hypothetical protein